VPAPAVRGQRWSLRQELKTSAQGITPVISAARTPQDFNGFDVRRIEQAEECVDAGAHRRSRISNAVHIDVDLIATEPADENARDRWARPLQVDAYLLAHGLREDGLRANDHLIRRNHAHGLHRSSCLLDEPSFPCDGQGLGERFDF
jgi:hypothetical protein